MKLDQVKFFCENVSWVEPVRITLSILGDSTSPDIVLSEDMHGEFGIETGKTFLDDDGEEYTELEEWDEYTWPEWALTNELHVEIECLAVV